MNKTWLQPRFLLPAILVLTLLQRAYFAYRTFDLPPDNGCVALMATHILQGERPLFLYGFNYSGALMAYIAAFVLAVLGISIANLVLSAILLTLGWVAMTYLLFKELIGPRAGLAAALCVAVPDWVTTWYTLAPDCSYSPLFLLGTTALWLCVRLNRRDLRTPALWLHVLSLGVVAGLGLWTHMLISTYLLCGALFLIPFFIRKRFHPSVLAPFAVGGLLLLLCMSPYFLARESTGSGLAYSWHPYWAAIKTNALILWNTTLAYMYLWPIGLPSVLRWAIYTILIAIILLYGCSLAAMKDRAMRRRALLPLAFCLFFFPFYLPHDLAAEATPRYIISTWAILTGGLFGAACAATSRFIHRPALVLLLLWTVYHAACAVVLAERRAPAAGAELEKLHQLVEDARAVGAGPVLLAGGYFLGGQSQSLSFLSQDEPRFVAQDLERYQPGAQATDAELSVAYASTNVAFTAVTNALYGLNASHRTTESSPVHIAYDIRVPRFLRRSIPPMEFSAQAFREISGTGPELSDRRRDSVIMGSYRAESGFVLDTGKERSLCGVSIMPLSVTGNGLPNGYLLEASRDGETFEVVKRVPFGNVMTYAAGGRVYSSAGYGWTECRFDPTAARYLRYTPLAKDGASDLWYISEVFVFEHLGENTSDPSSQRDAVVEFLARENVRFTACDRWLSAGIHARAGSTGELPAFPRYNRHLQMLGARQPMDVRFFVPGPGRALAVDGALAEECETILRDTCGGTASWKRTDFDDYTVFTFGESDPGAEVRLWWNGLLPLRP